MEEDSFNSRVGKIFGSLASSSSSSSPTTITTLSPSLWSLTDEEIERKEWIRDKTIPESESEPESRSFFGNPRWEAPEEEKSQVELREELEKDLEDLVDDDVDEPPRRQLDKPDVYNDEEWNIKSCIGQDCTLDYEEEEDGYDKLAVGTEKPGDRLYMREISDYGIAVDSCNELPDSLLEVERDPRANHLAAKIRLQEDAEAAKKIDSLRVSEDDETDGGHFQINTFEDGVNLKSILKRKNVQLDSKMEKRVRFEPACDDNSNGGFEGQEDTHEHTGSVQKTAVSDETNFSPQGYSSAVPDYIRNPSKYIHYTFDSTSDMDEESNKQACMDFLKFLKRSNNLESQPADASDDLPSVTFVPRKKTGDTIMAENSADLKQNQDDMSREFMYRRGLPMGIAAGDMQDTEVCAMEEDETEPVADGRNSSQRPGRKYRTKSRVELDEFVELPPDEP